MEYRGFTVEAVARHKDGLFYRGEEIARWDYKFTVWGVKRIIGKVDNLRKKVGSGWEILARRYIQNELETNRGTSS